MVKFIEVISEMNNIYRESLREEQALKKRLVELENTLLEWKANSFEGVLYIDYISLQTEIELVNGKLPMIKEKNKALSEMREVVLNA